MESPEHVPVLVEETLAHLEPVSRGLVVDCTVGLGGHAEALLERFPRLRLVGLDRDRRALERAAARLERFGERARLRAGRFSELEERLAEEGVERVDGVFADLGVSSLQLGEGGRGFSFVHDGPLDMRMGRGELTAAEIVNTYSEDALSKILRDYGEERQARRIARAILEDRESEPFETTSQLAQLIERVKGRSGGRRFDAKSRAGRRARRQAYLPQRSRIHPATQTFQALRIEVNRELDELRELLTQAVRLLERDGRLVLISYHSLEDRIVKHTFRELATGEIDPVTGRPLAESRLIEVLTRRPVRPGDDEVAANPRARSARLRAARRLETTAPGGTRER